MTKDSLPFTVLVSELNTDPIELYDKHAALKISIIERAGVRGLGDEWDVPGAYLLLDRHDNDGIWGCYAGKAPAGVRARIKTHLTTKDHWYRAVLIRRDTTYGFNSAEVGWLEGRLYDLLNASENVRLHNGNRPRDESLPPYDRQVLEMVILPVRRLLRMLGHDPASLDDTMVEDKKRTRTSRFLGVTIEQIVDAGLLEVGATLVSTNSVWPATCVVLAGGLLEYAGKTYEQPSPAAYQVKERQPTNGWDFWALETPNGLRSLATLRADYLEARGKHE